MESEERTNLKYQQPLYEISVTSTSLMKNLNIVKELNNKMNFVQADLSNTCKKLFDLDKSKFFETTIDSNRGTFQM